MAGRHGSDAPDDDTNGTAETHWKDGLEDKTGPMATGTPEDNAPAKPPPGTPGQGGTTATAEEGDGTAMRTTAPPQDA